MASQFLFRILEQRHHDTYLPALLSLRSRQKGEYRFRCRNLSFDGVAYDSVLTIQVGAPELNAVPTFLFMGGGNRLSAPR